ncbi:transmembrane protein, putative, partial [Bodo saltans]
SDNGTCVCSRGYWGDACGNTCPGGAASPCSNHGECSTDTGECTCDGTAYGLACEYPCPGGYNDPCSGSGVCGPTGACSCFASTALGFFAGAACDRCAPYYSGDACNVSCDPRTGAVVGKSCVCAAGFVGADCSLACPLSDDDGSVCSGRGACRAAASGTYAECVCEANYYGTVCGVYCTAAACTSTLGLQHAQCNVTTGTCECQDNDAGHFAGSTCNDCALLYWGPECDRACPCNGRGSCNRFTARCTCFAGEYGFGHFAGSACTFCASGYIGIDCETLNTEFSVAGSSLPPNLNVAGGAAIVASSATSPAILFRDGDFGVLYSGSTDVAAFASESWNNGTLTYLGRVRISDGNPVGSIKIFNTTHIIVSTVIATTTATAAEDSTSRTTTTVSDESLLALSQTLSYVFPRGSAVWNINTSVNVIIEATKLSDDDSSDDVSSYSSRAKRQDFHILDSTAAAALFATNLTLAAYDAASNVLAAASVNTTSDESTVHIRRPNVNNVSEVATLVKGSATCIVFMNYSSATANNTSSLILVVATTNHQAALEPSSSWWFALHFIDLATGSVLASQFSTELVGETTICNHTSGAVLCPFVSRCLASAELGVLVCAVSVFADDNTLLMSLPLTNLLVSGGVKPALLEVPEGGNVSAAAFDVLDNCVLLGMAPFSTTTQTSVYRVRVMRSSLAVISQLRFALAGAAYPVIQQMLVNSSSRSLFASLMVTQTSAVSSSATSTASVHHINLFGIWKVDPPVVDRDGGTLVTFLGTGFVTSPPPMCVLTDDTGAVAEAPAVFVDGGTVYCNATLSLAADSICDTATLDLRYANRTTMTTLVRMRRPLSATVLSATTSTSRGVVVSARSLEYTASPITIIGYGFVAGATASACRHESWDGKTTYFTAANATYLNSTLVVCHQPANTGPTPPGSVLRYSHDGFVYSPSSTAFAIVGDFSGVHVSVVGGEAATRLTADAITNAPTLQVETTDALGNRLGPFDTNNLAARCSLTSPALVGDSNAVQPGILNQTSLRRTTASGVALFDTIVLVAPSAGILLMYCYITANISSIGVASFTIATGAPNKVMIMSPQGAWRSGVLTLLTLDPSPEVALSDAANNVISDLAALPAFISLAFITINPSTKITNESHTSNDITETVPQRFSASVAEDGTYTFSGIGVRSPFGHIVQLRFTADGIADSVTISLSQESCTPSEYGVVGTFSCAPCPANALCDGSTTVTAFPGLKKKTPSEYGVIGTFSCSPCPADAVCDGSTNVAAFPGFWRSSAASVVMYECTPGDACPTALTCAAAYTGAVCGSCAPGFGRSGTACAACASAAANWGVTFAIVAALGVLVYALSVHTVAFTAIEDVAAGLAERVHEDSGVVSVVAKLVVSHLQVVALIPARALSLPQWLAGFLSGGGQASSFSPNLSYVACAVGNSPRSQLVALLVLLPILLCALGLAAFAKAYVAHRRYVAEAARTAAELAYRTARAGSLASRVRFRDVDHAAIASVVPSAAGQRVVRDAHADLLGWYDGDTPDGAPPRPAVPAAPSLAARTLNACAVVLVVVLFFVYPTLVQTAVGALPCRSIDAAGAGSYSVMTADPQTLCADTEPVFAATRTLAALVIALVGAGVPLLAPGVVLAVREATCGGSMDAARQLFFFATGGYRLWFWESVSMARKAAVALALALASAGQAQLIAGMWVAGAFALATAACDPWRHALCAKLDSLGQLVLFGTFLCLAATFSGSIAGSDARLTAVLAAALAMNVAFLAYAVLAVLEAARIRLQHEAKTSRAAKDALETLEGRSISQMGAKITSLRRDVVAQEARIQRSVAPFRELLLRHTNEHRYSVAVQKIALAMNVLEAFSQKKTVAVKGSKVDDWGRVADEPLVTNVTTEKSGGIPSSVQSLSMKGAPTTSHDGGATSARSSARGTNENTFDVSGSSSAVMFVHATSDALQRSDGVTMTAGHQNIALESWAIRSTKSVVLEGLSSGEEHGDDNDLVVTSPADRGPSAMMAGSTAAAARDAPTDVESKTVSTTTVADTHYLGGMMERLFSLPFTLAKSGSTPRPPLHPIPSAAAKASAPFDGAAFDFLDIAEDDYGPAAAPLARPPFMNDVVGRRHSSPRRRGRRDSASSFAGASAGFDFELGDVELSDVKFDEDDAALPMEMTIDPELINFDNFFSDDFGDDAAMGGGSSAVVHVRSPQPDDDVLSSILRANLRPQKTKTNRFESFSARILPTAFVDDFDFDEVPSFEIDDEEISGGILAHHHHSAPPEEDASLPKVKSIVSMRKPPLAGSIETHAVSPDELSNLSDDLDDLLARNLPPAASPRPNIDLIMPLLPPNNLSNVVGAPKSNHDTTTEQQQLGRSSSLDFPFSAEELQQLLTGTLDTHALVMMTTWCSRLFPVYADGSRREMSALRRLAMSSTSATGAGAYGTSSSPPAGRRGSTLNALPAGIVRSSTSNRLRRKSSLATPAVTQEHFHGDRDAIERRLTKAMCALQATYLLTPRLFGSVIADTEKRVFDVEPGDRPSSPSALSKRLERHLSGIMELEAHAMRLLVHWEGMQKKDA